MARLLPIKQQYSLEDLEQRYRKATDPVLRSHWQIIWLLSHGKGTLAVAEATGYSAVWIRELVHRYNDAGANGLGDRRHRNPGPVSLLSPEQHDDLRCALQEARPDGSRWTGPLVAAWMSEQLGRPVSSYRGWVYLHRLGYRLLVPRPRHAKTDPHAQELFKKNYPNR